MNIVTPQCALRFRDINNMDKVLQQIKNRDFDFSPRPKTKKKFTSYSRDPIKNDEERKQQ